MKNLKACYYELEGTNYEVGKLLGEKEDYATACRDAKNAKVSLLKRGTNTNYKNV